MALANRHCPEDPVRAAELGYQDTGSGHVAAYNSTIEALKAERE